MPRRSPLTCLMAACLLAGAVAPAAAAEISGYSGAEAYQRFCASCHGKGGEGDGPVAATLKIAVPDLRMLARRRNGQFPKDLVRRVIDGTEIKTPHGPRDMPVWGREFWVAQGADETARREAAALIDRLVQYLSGIQR
jgi:mono/diheme cytochrome c family protein